MSLFSIMPPKVLVILCKSSSPYNMTEQQTASLCLQRLRGWTTEWLDRGSCSIDRDPFEVRHVGKNQDTGWIFYNFAVTFRHIGVVSADDTLVLCLNDPNRNHIGGNRILTIARNTNASTISCQISRNLNFVVK